MTYIHQTALIGELVQIEEDVYIGPYCIIGFPPEWKGNEDNNAGVIVRRGSRLTGLVTVDAGAFAPTVIGENSYLMKHSHVGHDAVIGNDVTISCGAKIGGHCHIGDGTNIGLNAVIHQKVIVPAGCMIGASAFVGKKTEMRPGYKYAGVPAKELSENKR